MPLGIRRRDRDRVALRGVEGDFGLRGDPSAVLLEFRTPSPMQPQSLLRLVVETAKLGKPSKTTWAHRRIGDRHAGTEMVAPRRVHGELQLRLSVPMHLY